jgi:hypothetical protein
MVIWICALGMVISSLCVDTVLLNKAYKVHNRSRLILVAGIGLSLCQFSFIYVVVHHSVTRQPLTDGCLIDYPLYYPWQRLFLDLPVNIIFSISFLMVIVEQYRRFGLNAWAQLSEEGLIFMSLTSLSSIGAALIGALHGLGDYSDWIFVFDCKST